MDIFQDIAEAIIKGDADRVESEINKALKEGTGAGDIFKKGLIKGISVVGERMGTGEIFLPEVMMSAGAMHAGLDIIRPLLAQSGQKLIGKVIIGTVEGDIHDIGKKIVGSYIEGNGFDVVDLGVNVKAESFAQAVADYKPHILAMSSLLTTTMPNMGETINLLKEKGLRETTKIIVGGASVNNQFAKLIGADGYAPEANSAAQLVKRLIEAK